MRSIVSEGRFEFVGGGLISSADESLFSKESFVQQMNEGHEFLKKEFGYKPKIAFQMNSLGHSSLTPSLLHSMGFQSLMISSISSKLLIEYHKKKQLEFIWKWEDLSDENKKQQPKSPGLFTHIADSSSSYNVSNADNVVKQWKDRAESFRNKMLLVPWVERIDAGIDTHSWSSWESLDNLIGQINSDGKYKIKVEYSTFSDYFLKLKSISETNHVGFPTFGGDFFPFNNSGMMHSGHFSESLRGKRELFSLLRHAQLLHTLAKHESELFDRILSGESNSTSLNESKFPYEELQSRLNNATWDLSMFLDQNGYEDPQFPISLEFHENLLASAKSNVEKALEDSTSFLHSKGESKASLHYTSELKLLNNGETSTQCLPFIVSNPLGWSRDEIIKVIVDIPNVRVEVDYSEIQSQVNPVFTRMMGNNKENIVQDDHYELYFEARISALSSKTFFLCPGETEWGEIATPKIYTKTVHRTLSAHPLDGNSKISIENSKFRLDFNGDGLLDSIHDNAQSKSHHLSVQFYEYLNKGSTGTKLDGMQGTESPVSHLKNTVIVTKGVLVHKVTTFFGNENWVSFSLYTSDSDFGFIQVEQSVKVTGKDRSLAVRFSTDLSSGNIFWTDDGFRMMERARSKSIEGSYLPYYSTSFIQDKKTHRQFTIISDQSGGASSPSSGSLEVMLYHCARRNSDKVVYKNFRILFENFEETEEWFRINQLRMEHPIRVLASITPIDRLVWNDKYWGSYSPLGFAELPHDVHLFSLKAIEGSDDAILQLVHVHEPIEGKDNSVYLNTGHLFAEKWEILKQTNRGLSAQEEENNPLTFSILDFEKLSGYQNKFQRLKIGGGHRDHHDNSNASEENLGLILQPLRIKTVIIRLLSSPFGSPEFDLIEEPSFLPSFIFPALAALLLLLLFLFKFGRKKGKKLMSPTIQRIRNSPLLKKNPILG
eukprot:TRINITY_DN1196_c0_g1_i2.p1 TRINITY_DN1196_c0_g1~~TRINITY_DN1196_c0_g1_i2.p1  ORF type:complete len:1092 (+),score=223.19 TRINITY_DN1196_c0_g1_i2:453-3278(+)